MQELIFGKTAPGLHDKVMTLMAGEKAGLLLDAPSGEGELSHWLSQKGFEVTAGDIDRAVFKPDGIKFQELNLNESLPFNDASFDYIVSIEGIEHLENPFHLFREFARILKPGGKMILSTPNTLNVFSRLRYFLIGFPEHFGDYYSQAENFYVLHINMMGFPEIKTAYERCGFVLEELAANRNNVWSRGVFPGVLMTAALPVIRWFTRRKVKDAELGRLLLEKELLSGEILILKLRKESA